MKHALILSLGLAFAATASVSPAHDAIGDAVAPHEPKSWFTPAQKAYISAKCGVDVDARHSNFDIHGSVMTCPDGRRVDDPQVKAIGDDVSRRATEFAASVMKQADVQRAIAMTAHTNVRKALAEANIDARVAEAMAHAAQARAASAEARRAVDAAHIDEQVRDALAQADIGRRTAERVRDALAKAGMSETR